MSRPLLLCALTVASASLAHDQVPSCSEAMLSRARAHFKTEYQAKKYAQALKVYDDLRASCELMATGSLEVIEQFYWVQSDTALAQLKLGQAKACLQTLVPLMNPMYGYQGAGIDTDATVAKAIDFNEALCRKAEAARFAAFLRQPCPAPLKGPKVRSSVTLSGGRCLFLLEPEANHCPAVMLAKKVGEPGRVLRVTEGPLADDSACCALDQLAFKGDQLRVESSAGQTHPCTGGTALTETSATYALRADSELTLVEDTSIGSH